MSVEELLEKTTIDFPRPIRLPHAEELLCYIAANLPANVGSTIEYFNNFRYDPEKERVLEDKGTLKLSATVTNLKKSMAFDAFVSKSWEKDPSWISGIEFQRVPAWELSEYKPEVRQLWEDVRTIVDKYFKEVLKGEGEGLKSFGS